MLLDANPYVKSLIIFNSGAITIKYNGVVETFHISYLKSVWESKRGNYYMVYYPKAIDTSVRFILNKKQYKTVVDYMIYNE
jgi:hypothetical protein